MLRALSMVSIEISQEITALDDGCCDTVLTDDEALKRIIGDAR